MKSCLKSRGFAGAILLLLACAGSALATGEKAQLSAADCIKCHESQPAQIEASGASHKNAINCRDCHASHRPKVAENIPECSMCHSDSDHFELPGCQRCHNPHAPLDVVLEGELKEECLTCHTEQNEQLVAQPSSHTEVACNFCHAETHGVIPECLQCHDGHSEEMTQADCSSCHQAHQPLVVTYGGDTGNPLCGSCHDDVLSTLQASQTKHQAVLCVDCHVDRHKTVPQCADCHGEPHGAGIHAKFPSCGACHNIAHDLVI